MSARVTVVGSLNMDLVIRAARIPRPGETILGGMFQTAPGGKGANQAVAAARLGGHVAMVGRVGEDDFGRALRQTLAEDGVNHDYVLPDPEAPTGVALIVVDESGENSIVVASGANMRLTPADVAAAEPVIARADVVLLQLEIPLATVRKAVELARNHGVRVVLNPAPAQVLPADLLAQVDVLVPNESETALLTGRPIRDRGEMEAAARQLLTSGTGTVVLTLGERGAYLEAGDRSGYLPAFHVQPVDTTAAGDAFVGGFAVAVGEGRPLIEAVRWGNAAGALATTRFGAQPSLPTRQEVESLLEGAKLQAPEGDNL